jgi:hypothetical protein
MELHKEAATEPQTFKGYSAVATLYPDRVEIRRNRIAKMAGHKDSTTYLRDIIKPHGKEPTRLVNGYVHLSTQADPPHLKALTLDLPKTWTGNERSLLFTWNQRTTQAAFHAAVLDAWRQTYGGADLA